MSSNEPRKPSSPPSAVSRPDWTERGYVPPPPPPRRIEEGYVPPPPPPPPSKK